MKINGEVAFQGYAMGKIIEYKKTNGEVYRRRITDIESEINRVLEARNETIKELQNIYIKAVKEVGEANAAIFEVHQMLLEDDDYMDSIENIIQVQEVNAEYAVAITGDNFAAMFEAMEDEYMRERSADIQDISSRLIKTLLKEDTKDNILDNASIIVADDLLPSETVQLDKEKVVAFVTRKGSVNSHTAILARTMNIPALVNANVPVHANNTMGIVDGEKGILIVEPDENEIALYYENKKKEEEKQKLLQKYKAEKAITKSGKEIKLYANIGGIGDINEVHKNNAAGIGLFRSEFLYLEKNSYPTEEEQFQVYKTILEMMAGKPVIIRTLDIGADKKIDYFELEEEDNPALGYRAIRICLSREEIFKTQLRALLRASTYGNLAILIPMIISEWEIIKVKEILEQVKEELREAHIKIGKVELGVMIETPASVMIADELAKHVDFFSIGSNDLTQYTLAIDRQNSKLDMFYDAHHPAVLKMIQMVIESAHSHGIWAGICGELGADLKLTDEFIKWGIDELSVSPSAILPIKEKIIKYK